MYGEGSRGLPRMTGDAVVLAASELAKRRICPGGSVRGSAATNSDIPTFLLQLEQSKTGPDCFSNFMLCGPAKSVTGPVVMKGNETCHVSCNTWW